VQAASKKSPSVKGCVVKLSKLARIFSAVLLLLAFENLLNAQEDAQRPSPKHTRYKFIDLGTLGGPVSYESPNGEGNQLLNNSGVVAFSADTATPDPNAPDFCFSPGCFVTHAVRWKNGVLTDLGALTGANGSSTAGAINAHGWSAGYAGNGLIDPLIGVPVSTAVFWKGEEIHDVGTLGGVWSLATGITNDGVVVGMATIDDLPDPFASILGPWPSATHPFIWKDAQMIDLGTLGGPDAFVAAGCVNQGLVVGSSLVSSTPDSNTGVPPVHPFAWAYGKMIDLGTLGGNFGTAQCGNNRGQVIGQASLAGDLAFHPFLWEGGILRDLGTLGGENGTPVWINDAGDVVGQADLEGSQVHHAFLWRNGVMKDLGTLDGNSHATAINSKGQVVGYFSLSGRDAPPFRHPFIWEEGGPMVDLNSLIPANSGLELVAADNINERGEIIGVGVPDRCFPDFCGHLFLLIPCAADDFQACEDNGEPTTTTIQGDPATAVKSSAISPQVPLAPKESVAACLEQMAKRYDIHRRAAPRD
jgi:probable HAF family extracellular repeat protein